MPGGQSFKGGVYIHIPFCRQACHYCNFHFTTSLHYKSALLNALQKELILKSRFFNSTCITSIYLGGGTPSLLTTDEINDLYYTIDSHYTIDSGIEITMECNPDDLTIEYLDSLISSPVNRLSIGIQSFHSADLEYMGRVHNARQAHQCLDAALSRGFTNITADLIFGFPGLSDEKLQYNLAQLTGRDIPHISAYNLTVEEKTRLHKMIRARQHLAPEEQQNAAQFISIHQTLHAAGYEHYEISNYCKSGMEAKHNSAYWLGLPYLGFGPAAHSYYGGTRSFNIPHNQRYIKAINADEIPAETETIDAVTGYNELILTRLRTKWGVSVQEVADQYPESVDWLIQQAAPYIAAGEITAQDGVYTLTLPGMLIADHITVDLFR